MANERRNIARAAGVVGSLTLLSRITGLLRDAVVGYCFGAGMAAEAFFVAFRFPNLFRRLVAEGAMSVAFVPVFADLLANRSSAEAQRGLGAMLGVALLALGALSLGGALLAPLWIDLFAPGFADRPELRQMAVRLTYLTFPYLTLIGLVAVLAGYLNACRHFAAPALSPALLNLAIIAAALLLQPYLRVPVEALAYGVLFGGACQLALQVAFLRWRRVPLRPLWAPGNEAVRRAGRLLVPATLGTAIFQVNVLIGTVLASLLPVGSVSYLWYADRVFEFPLGLFAAAVGTAALPSMATQAARGDLVEMRDSLSFSIALTSFIAVPATVGLVLLAEPIVALLFERGAFGAFETAMTARALRCYSIGLWSVAAVRTLAPAYYALGEARIPVFAAIVAVAVNIAMSFALIGPLDGAPAMIAAFVGFLSIADLGHSGLALATSIAATINALILAALLVRRLGGFDRTAVLGSLARSGLASLPMAIVVITLSRWLLPAATAGLLQRGLVMAVVITCGAISFAAAAAALGGPEIARARRMLVARLRRQGAVDDGV